MRQKIREDIYMLIMVVCLSVIIIFGTTSPSTTLRFLNISLWVGLIIWAIITLVIDVRLQREYNEQIDRVRRLKEQDVYVVVDDKTIDEGENK